MQSINQLVERQCRESELRLRHIDELTAAARQPPADSPRSAGKDRESLARVSRRRTGLRSALEALGLQFEQTLTAILDRGAL